jgi:hypothetical protein
MVSWFIIMYSIQILFGVCHYVQNSNGQFVFVIRLHYSNGPLVFVITCSIQTVRWCSLLRKAFKRSFGVYHQVTVFKWSDCLCHQFTEIKRSLGVCHYVQHSNGLVVFLVTYIIQMFSLCLSLRTAFNWSVCVCPQVAVFIW